MASVRQSLALSIGQKHAATAISLVSTIVLARILTPEQFGVFGVGFATISIAAGFRAFGVGDYLIKEPEVTRAALKAAFGVNLLVTWMFGGLFLVTSSAIGELYGDPRVAGVVQVLSLTFFLLPFGVSTFALLRRGMAFDRIFWINISGATANSATAILLALMGLGAMSLAYASVASSVVILAATVLLGRPQFVWPSLRGAKAVIAFGGLTSSLRILTQLGEQLPALLVGRTLGLDAVGVLGRAQRAISPFQSVIIRGMLPVALPSLAAHRRSGKNVREPYLLGLQYLTAIAWPFFIFVAAMADPLVALVLGDQWTDVVPIIRILCASGALLPLIALNRPVFVALDQLSQLFRIQLITQPAKMTLVVLASFHSLAYVAFALAVFPLVTLWLTQRALRRSLNYTLVDFSSNLTKSLLIALLSSIPPAVIMLHVQNSESPTVTLIIASVSTFATWVSALFVTSHPLKSDIRRTMIKISASMAAKRYAPAK